MIEFVNSTLSEFNKVYEAIERYCDNACERRQVLIHGFKEFPTELLKNYIFKDPNPIHSINIDEIPSLALNNLILPTGCFVAAGEYSSVISFKNEIHLNSGNGVAQPSAGQLRLGGQ